MVQDDARCFKLINVLLYLASEKGRKPLPFAWDTLTLEIAAALYELLTGQDGFSRKLFDPDHRTLDPGWVSNFNAMLDAMLADHGHRIIPSLRRSLHRTLRISWHDNAAPDRGRYPANEVHEWYCWCMGGYKKGSDTFAWSVPDAEQIGAYINGELGPEVLDYCQAIADLMKKHVARDMENLSA